MNFIIKKKYLLKNGGYLLKIKKWYDEFDAFEKRSCLLLDGIFVVIKW